MCGEPFVKSVLFECWNYLNSCIRNGHRVTVEKSDLHPKKEQRTMEYMFDHILRNSSTAQFDDAAVKVGVENGIDLGLSLGLCKVKNEILKDAGNA